MTVKRFREVRRGFLLGAAPGPTLNNITVLLEGDAGLGFVTNGRGVLFMEVFLMAISPQVATAGGCLIRRVAYTEALGTWEVNPERDHRSSSFSVAGSPVIGISTTPFPIGPPVLVGGVPVNGAFPINYIDFGTTGGPGSWSALIQYQLVSSLSINQPTTRIHYQITMEGFEVSELFDLP
jgi:hypothetical protein